MTIIRDLKNNLSNSMNYSMNRGRSGGFFSDVGNPQYHDQMWRGEQPQQPEYERSNIPLMSGAQAGNRLANIYNRGAGLESLINPPRTAIGGEEDRDKLMEMQRQTYRNFLAKPPTDEAPIEQPSGVSGLDSTGYGTAIQDLIESGYANTEWGNVGPVGMEGNFTDGQGDMFGDYGSGWQDPNNFAIEPWRQPVMAQPTVDLTAEELATGAYDPSFPMAQQPMAQQPIVQRGQDRDVAQYIEALQNPIIRDHRLRQPIMGTNRASGRLRKRHGGDIRYMNSNGIGSLR